MPSRKRQAKPPTTPRPRSDRVPPPRHVVVLFALGILGLLAVVFWWAASGGRAPIPPPQWPPASDPRLTTASPYLNVRPDVRYVGDKECADCHANLARSYGQHPMGRSLAPMDSALPVERYDGDRHNPFERDGFQYSVDRRGRRVGHRVIGAGGAVRAEAEVAFAIGSGRRGRSYLIEDDGYLFQSPITWYPLKGIWDLSPGYNEPTLHFTRPIVAECLFCHANQVEPDNHAA